VSRRRYPPLPAASILAVSWTEVYFPKVSQEMRAEMVGTTRSRVNFFMNKFRKLDWDFIQYKGRIQVNNSLPSVVLHD
jgi:CRP/FNR family transcriptional regulator, cyclic AMP receptor protein